MTIRINTFDDAARAYASITPLRSPEGKKHDVRPLGERRYSWERIIKLSDCCYVLSDGWHWGNPYRPCHSYGVDVATEQNLRRFAPIVWHRHPDGLETVSVRNAGRGSNTVSSRHAFLHRYLPRWITLQGAGSNRSGKHFLSVPGSSRTYFPLATKIAPELLNNPSVAGSFARHGGVAVEDQATVTFEHVDGRFRQISPILPEPMKRVDRETKAAFKDDIQTFIDWARLMLPMLNLKEWEVRAQHISAYTKYKWNIGGDSTAVRNVLQDFEHPHRLDMAVTAFAESARWAFDGNQYTDFAAIPTRLHAWINKQADFYKTVPRGTV